MSGKIGTYKTTIDDALNSLNSLPKKKLIDFPYGSIEKDVFTFLFGEKEQGVIENKIFDQPINRELFNYLCENKKIIIGFRYKPINKDAFVFSIIDDPAIHNYSC